jgi:hypothetical protein
MVRYGKVLLPKLQLVRNSDGLPAALVTAQEMVRCIDETRNRDLFPNPIVVRMGDRHVLRLQLLLLAFQAKLLSREQGHVSCVRCLQPGARSQPRQQQQQQGVEQPQQQHTQHEQQQQQLCIGQLQQEQQSEEDEEPIYYANSDLYMNHVHVPGDHQLLLAGCLCEQADLAALEQQHLAAMHHVR